jgi:hypothetical protein
MKEWYSVRCIFHHPKRNKKKGEYLYEERILLWRANDLDQAIELAEEEAKQYEKDANCVYIGLSQGYHTFLEIPESGSEVYSLMREDESSPDDYLDFYFDTGSERQKHYKED